ncbi:MAG TPA: IS1182 family transposase [Pirellulales bacterium]|jgi:transposase|nr:IS1182 family transposase [Pirellulales bacterium]
MTQWARAPQNRDQLTLFTHRLDDALPASHTVRLLDEILGRIDWSLWESHYNGRLGQPPIHPRVLAGALLYGLLMRIRSSRALEDAVRVRIDFRWLVEGRTIDHTTLSEFRRCHAEALQNLFVQIGLIARGLGFLSLERLAFDGTRVRANNRRSGTRSEADLHRMQAELKQKFVELEARAAAEDDRDDETFGGDSVPELPAELTDVRRRLAEVDAALAELERVKQSGETVPSRLPLTDPQSRVTPNKDGGFAPNYTPLATVDVASGLIVSADVIAMTNEEQHLVPAILDVQEQFSLSVPPPEMLSDGMMCSGANLAALEELGVTLYSPIETPDPANPALRDDPRQPVPPEQWERLPRQIVRPRGGEKQPQLTKAAFVYDEEEGGYWCPQGQKLVHRQTTSERTPGGQVVRARYVADAAACAECPLRHLCLQAGAKQRQISRDQHESHRQRHAQRMATPEAQAKYAQRRHPGERPFAMIKHHFGARRFLLRGLRQVTTEWRWLATAFNLQRLMSLMRSRAGPEAAGSFFIPNPL